MAEPASQLTRTRATDIGGPIVERAHRRMMRGVAYGRVMYRLLSHQVR
jgi:hypothetical protein